ncbi:hypothetical protein [Flavobacterium sp. T12S277]|uniref:hypothetical protein n=1 Tax=Flavobacterium sp. T12S277 TaxID=3402752 RepID=UPI003AD8E1D8
MDSQLRNWTSKALVFFGMWLWQEKEYGHAMLCMHAPQLGLKIGTQLNITWNDVINPEDGLRRDEVNLRDKDTNVRNINTFFGQLLEMAYYELSIKNSDDFIYINYKTGKQLTSSTLNRELQALVKRFERDVKERTGLVLDYKPLKTNAFEIAWAMDMVKKYNYSKQVFIAVSNFMGHRTLKDTIKLLEIEPIEKIEFDFNNVPDIQEFVDFNTFNFRENLKNYLDFKGYIDSDGQWYVPQYLK